jgi:hypothetical protein
MSAIVTPRGDLGTRHSASLASYRLAPVSVAQGSHWDVGELRPQLRLLAAASRPMAATLLHQVEFRRGNRCLGLG